MFDYVVHKPKAEPGKPRYMTATVSALAHVVILLAAVGLPILYASDELPDPPDMMAFVVDAPPPPPPPPPPAPAPPAERKPAPAAKPDQPTVQVQKPIANANPVAAPVEAPSAVKPETGLENAGPPSTGAANIEAGFERGIEGGVIGGAVGGVETTAPPPPPPPPPPKPTGPVRVGGKVKAPALAHRVNPAYPPMAQSAQIEGVVVLEATVDKQGGVRAVRVVRGNPLLDPAAIAAVKQWRYEPLTLNGEPMEFILTVTVNFSIPR
jgi:protein TonB